MKEEESPEEFVCPISGRVMEDPVYLTGTEDHAAYEREYAEKLSPRLSPLNKQPFSGFTPADELKEKIQAWKKSKENQLNS